MSVRQDRYRHVFSHPHNVQSRRAMEAGQCWFCASFCVCSGKADNLMDEIPTALVDRLPDGVDQVHSPQKS